LFPEYGIVITEREVNKMVDENKILSELEKFYESEVRMTKTFLEYPPTWAQSKMVINNTIQRCLGVAQYVQFLDVPFEKVTRLYEQTRIDLEELERG
jgi:hypothetical protein